VQVDAPTGRIMTVNEADLTMILADRLAAIVPPGFHVQASHGMLRYSAEEGRFPGQQGSYHVGPAGTDVRANLGGPGDPDADTIVRVAVLALDHLQDYVSEATHDPWPGTSSQPRPSAQIRGPVLRLWYGEHDNFVLACQPIPLADILSPR
jgi:hypothetical protein